jgi:hypothetical protein
MYRRMHAEGEKFLGVPPEQTFPGLSLPPQAPRIKRLIERTGALNLLDYGSGKGRQYDQRDVRLPGGDVVESIVDYWGVDYVHCYDPSYPPLSALPQGKFDGVVCTDVLEHVPEEDVAWVVEELFGYASRFVYANVACYRAKKRLPNGENAHCTIRPPEWWKNLFEGIAPRHPGIQWELAAHAPADGIDGGPLIDRVFNSIES